MSVPTTDPRIQTRSILDEYGENMAVRSFLMMYGAQSCTIEGMRNHLKYSGFNMLWPEWADVEEGHLTSGGAQDWIRFLFFIESSQDEILTLAQKTAPHTIFLHIAEDDDALEYQFPKNHEDVTWGTEEHGMASIEYIRSDLMPSYNGNWIDASDVLPGADVVNDMFSIDVLILHEDYTVSVGYFYLKDESEQPEAFDYILHCNVLPPHWAPLPA